MSTCIAYITTQDADEAKRIGHTLVRDRIAACVNIIDGMTSIYWWEGEIEEGKEAVLIAKTRRDLMSALVKAVEDLHAAECPCVIQFNIDGGHAPFIEWINSETA